MIGKQHPVDRREFEARLSAVCGGGVIVLPRKQRDRHILFRAIAQTLESKSPYSERELNSSLREWIGSIGGFLTGKSTCLDASLDECRLMDVCRYDATLSKTDICSVMKEGDCIQSASMEMKVYCLIQA